MWALKQIGEVCFEARYFRAKGGGMGGGGGRRESGVIFRRPLFAGGKIHQHTVGMFFFVSFCFPYVFFLGAITL